MFATFQGAAPKGQGGEINAAGNLDVFPRGFQEPLVGLLGRQRNGYQYRENNEIGNNLRIFPICTIRTAPAYCSFVFGIPSRSVLLATNPRRSETNGSHWVV